MTKHLFVGGPKDGQMLPVYDTGRPMLSEELPHFNTAVTAELPTLTRHVYFPMKLKGAYQLHIVFVYKGMDADAVTDRLLSNYRPQTA